MLKRLPSVLDDSAPLTGKVLESGSNWEAGPSQWSRWLVLSVHRSGSKAQNIGALGRPDPKME